MAPVPELNAESDVEAEAGLVQPLPSTPTAATRTTTARESLLMSFIGRISFHRKAWRQSARPTCGWRMRAIGPPDVPVWLTKADPTPSQLLSAVRVGPVHFR